MLPTLVDRVPGGEDWVHELKLDGYRILARIDQGRVRLLTRNENDWTARFASLAQALRAFPARQALIDGELVALRGGKASFQALQNALRGQERAELMYIAFDLLYCDGHDWRGATLLDRKAELARRCEALATAREGIRVRYSQHLVGHGQEAFGKACAQGLEGIVSKRADSTYVAGRTRDWQKRKCIARQELVIGGFTPPGGTRSGFGSLLLGYYDTQGKLIACGRVGTGFNARSLAEISARLSKLETTRSPFEGARLKVPHGTRWVRPRLVAEIAFSEWTGEGRLRQPVFLGLREDKDPKSIGRERPAHLASARPPRRIKRK